MQKYITCLCLLLPAVTQACSSGDRIGGPFGVPTYVLAQRNGQSVPVALDADTTPGSVHYSLIADTIRVDVRAALFVGTNVERLVYIGSPLPPAIQRAEYEFQYSENAGDGTAVLVCLPPGAPCAYITESFVLDDNSLVITRNEASPTVYVYRRIR